MDSILELASELGKRIAADPRGQAMIDAGKALEASLPDRKLLEDYDALQRKVAQLEADGKPIEPEDKRGLVAMRDKVASSPVLKTLLKAQVEYVSLMNQVSARIEQAARG
jgi:cell fate (sporulation/competence/biofilm development) regulator YlbF (YheA/YmcA/DUF963 family)